MYMYMMLLHGFIAGKQDCYLLIYTIRYDACESQVLCHIIVYVIMS